MGEGRANHPAAQERSPQGGVKDTDDLSGVKGVQEPGMAEKARQVQDTPQDVTGAQDGIQPIIKR